MKTITSLQNPIVKRLVKLRDDSNFRYHENSVIIEGIKPVCEVCKENKTKTLILSHEQLLPQGINAEEIYLVDHQIMKKISGMQSPEGIVAEVEKPAQASLKGSQHVVAFDRINDPANMGMLIRTALALGWDGAFILNNSCDPFNEKALRTARGATFRLPIAFGSWESLISLIKAEQLHPLVADINGNAPTEILHMQKKLLILGNEAHGASPEALNRGQKISIPMSGKMESLNVSVAGGILMYLLRKI